jgi:hemolysin activation/secretion protein
MPRLSRPEVAADTKPLFQLHGVSLTGAQAIPRDQIIGAYQPYLGKQVSQADLAAIAGSISDLYRAAGFHLSRAIVPAQDIADGRVRLEVIEGGITEVALKGEGAEQFGVRPLLAPVLAEHPSRLATLERQLLLINGRPGVRIADTALEEIGGPTGHFRLIVYVKTWHIYTSFGVDNLGSSAVGPWQTYAMGAFNSYLLPGDTLALNLSTTPGDPRELAFGRLSYDVPVGADGMRIGASALYSEVRPGDFRRLYNDNTRTDAFEIRGSIVPLQSQRSALTLTAAAGFSNVSESNVFGPFYNDHIPHREPDLRLQAAGQFRRQQLLHTDVASGSRYPGRLAPGRRFSVARRRVGQFLGNGCLVHTLSDAVRRLVGENVSGRPDRLRPAVHLAAILSGRCGLRTGLRQRRDQRRQWHRRLA